MNSEITSFLVGGAVRDRLLGYPVSEQDWVVIGETTDSMLARGFRPVGKDFPVFLHPDTQEEYALARTERKTAPGYSGFVFHASPDVSLEQDLIRRDLTINAMALSHDGQLIDPYHGQADLEKRLLRHVSSAFSEDPVRILRVARFAARYAHLGFRVAPETLDLMRQMVSSGETEHLVAERVWAELHKALQEQHPVAFFEVLRNCGALAIIFPEIAALFGVPQPAQHHPEIDTGMHIFMVLEQASRLSAQADVRLAALLHDLGKAVTPAQHWPSHHGHEQKGLPVLARLCDRLRVPRSFRALAEDVMEYHTHCHRARELRAETLVDFLHKIGAFREHNHLEGFLLACEADARGRTGFENRDYGQADFIRGAMRALQQIDMSAILESDLKGPAIGAAIRQQRIACLKQYKQENACA